MSSNPFDVLGTVFLWICFCISTAVFWKCVVGDQNPPAPAVIISRHHIEPQVVVPPPLWSSDLPPPREPPQPTFEPRPEPAPLPRRRNGLIPRAERRVRPAVLPERPVQRKRHMTEMSTRERVAAADKEAAREAYEVHKAQDLLWRSKAIAHEEAEAERQREAASRTGGERKQLGLDLEAAKVRPGKAQNVQIERPPHGGGNALTGTALGDKVGSAYAPPMEIEEAGIAAQPLAGEVDESDHTPVDDTSKVPEDNSAAPQGLGGEVHQLNQQSAQIASDYTPAGDAVIVAEEQINTGPINVPDPVNPLLEQQDASQAWEMLTSWLIEAESSVKNLTPDRFEAVYQDLCLLFAFWSQWMECGGDEIWNNVQGSDIIPHATFASDVHSYVTQQLGEVTLEMENVYQWMNAAREYAEKQEQARIYEEQEQARIYEEQEQARINEEQRQQSIHMAQMLQQQQLAQDLQAQKQEEQARINEEQRQEAIAQQQQLAQNPPVEEDDEDLYGNDACGEKSLQAYIAARKIESATSQSDAANAARPEVVQATEQKLEADALMDEDTQTDTAVQQQPVTEATNNMQQASASSAVIEKLAPTPTTGVLRRLGNMRQDNSRNGRPRRRNADRPQPVVQAPKPPGPPKVRVMSTASIKDHESQWLIPHDITEAQDMKWTYQDIDPNDNHHPLTTSRSDEANVVLVKTWLEQNNDCVDDLRRRLHAPEFINKDETEQYMLLFDQTGVKPKIKQMSDRYRQLRDYACIQCGDTQVFEWQDYVIFPNEIRTNGLKTLAKKDLSFLSDMRNALRPASENQDDISPNKPDYKLVFEAYEIALSVLRSMRHITAPAQIAMPDSGPLAGDDSDLSDCDEPVDGST